MRLKAGVNVCGVRPEVLLALQVAEAVYAEHGAELVVTSLNDGIHRRGSLHFVGLAADLRVHNLPSDPEIRRRVTGEIAERLGPDFDVVYEADGTANAHLHVEFQRKRAD